MKKIAIDAMGGDYAPQSIVEGVNQALNDFSDIEVILYGDEAKIKQYLKATERVRIVHTDEKINSDDEIMLTKMPVKYLAERFFFRSARASSRANSAYVFSTFLGSGPGFDSLLATEGVTACSSLIGDHSK